MKPTELTKKYVISTYVEPARIKGEMTLQVKVGKIQKELGWTNRTPSVFSTLSSRDFQEEAGLELIEKTGGPPSGGPSTTWLFVYRVLTEDIRNTAGTKVASSGGGLTALWGICKDMYRSDGGGEAFIRSQREDFGSIVSDAQTLPEVQKR